MIFFIVIFGYLIISSFFTYGAGWLVLFFTKNQNYNNEDVFGRFSLAFIVGYLLISSITAIVATSGVSLSWLVLLPLVYFLYRTSSPSKQEFQQPEFFPFAVAGVVIAVSFFGVWLLNGSPLSLEELNVHDDYYFFGKTAGTLIETGIESPKALHYHNIGLQTNEFYHFGNLWFSAFFIQIFNCSEVAFIVFVSYPLLISIGILGCLRFFSPRNAKQTILYLSLIVLAFLGGNLFINSDNEILNDANLWYGQFFGSKPDTLKLVSAIAITPLLIHFILNRKFVNIACFILIISGIYVTILPGLFGIFAGVLFWCYLFDENYAPKELIKCSMEGIITLLVGVLFLVCYQTFATESEPPKPMFEITKWDAFVWALRYFSYPFIMFIGLLPSLIWAKRTKSQQLSAILFCFIFGLFTSVCFVMLNIFQMDINQVIINFVMVFMPIILVYFLSKLKSNPQGIILGLAILSLTTTYKLFFLDISNDPKVENSYKFEKEVYVELRHHNWVLVRKNVPWKWYFIYNNPAKFVLNHPKTIYPVDITSGIQKRNNSPFNKAGFDIPVYLKEKKVKFIFAENGAKLPEGIKLDLVTRDPKSGHQFYKIKY